MAAVINIPNRGDPEKASAYARICTECDLPVCYEDAEQSYDADRNGYVTRSEYGCRHKCGAEHMSAPMLVQHTSGSNAAVGQCATRRTNVDRRAASIPSVVIEPSSITPGAWCWSIVSADGDEIAYGATIGRKSDIKRSLAAFVSRTYAP